MSFFLSRINWVLALLYVVMIGPLWIGFLRDSDTASTTSALGRFIFAQRQEVYERSKSTMLNVLMPESFRGLAGFVTGNNPSDGVNWDGYVSYFQYAASVLPVPLNADAFALSGFCQFHLGLMNEALRNYQRAYEINPVFLANVYNVAVMQFRLGNYSQVAELVSRLIALKPELSFQVIASSKIYVDILREVPGFDIHQNVNHLYSDALRALVISLYRMNQFEPMNGAIRFAKQSGFVSGEFFDFYATLGLSTEADRIKAEYFLNQSGDSKSDFYSGRDIAVRIF